MSRQILHSDIFLNGELRSLENFIVFRAADDIILRHVCDQFKI